MRITSFIAILIVSLGLSGCNLFSKRSSKQKSKSSKQNSTVSSKKSPVPSPTPIPIPSLSKLESKSEFVKNCENTYSFYKKSYQDLINYVGVNTCKEVEDHVSAHQELTLDGNDLRYFDFHVIKYLNLKKLSLKDCNIGYLWGAQLPEQLVDLDLSDNRSISLNFGYSQLNLSTLRFEGILEHSQIVRMLEYRHSYLPKIERIYVSSGRLAEKILSNKKVRAHSIKVFVDGIQEPYEELPDVEDADIHAPAKFNAADKKHLIFDAQKYLDDPLKSSVVKTLSRVDLANVKLPERTGESVKIEVPNSKKKWVLEVKKALGSGGFGSVFEVSVLDDLKGNHSFAVKYPLSRGASSKTEMVNEAKRMNLFNGNEGFPSIYGLLWFNEVPTIWMELAKKDLKNEKLNKKGFLQLAEGLKTLKDRKITHGDFKPGNMLVNKNGDWLISDVGGSVNAKIGKAKLMPCTQFFAAPELYHFNHKMGKMTRIIKAPKYLHDPYKVDSYSLGVSMFLLYFKEKNKINSDSYGINEALQALGIMYYTEVGPSIQKYLIGHEPSVIHDGQTLPADDMLRAIYLSVEAKPEKRINVEALLKILSGGKQDKHQTHF